MKPYQMAPMFGDLAKQGLRECSHCSGYGSSLKEEQEKCSVCTGSGVVLIEPGKGEEANGENVD